MSPTRTALALVAGAVVALAPLRASALDKQSSAHAGAISGPETGFNVAGALMLGWSFFNPSYPARPDNTGLTLLRYAVHADIDVIGRRLSIPVDVNLFTDRKRSGAGTIAPSELDLISGLTSTWRAGPGAVELGLRGEIDAPVDRGILSQGYLDARLRYLYSVATVAPSVGAALGDGDISGWFTLGTFLFNPSYAARPDLSGLALLRYQGHVEVSLFHDWVSVALDATMFTDRKASNVVRPCELDLIPELILRATPFELHLAFESDMPLDRPGVTQSFAHAMVVYAFDSSGKAPEPVQTRQQNPHGH